jgi:hypothetical protein
LFLIRLCLFCLRSFRDANAAWTVNDVSPVGLDPANNKQLPSVSSIADRKGIEKTYNKLRTLIRLQGVVGACTLNREPGGA